MAKYTRVLIDIKRGPMSSTTKPFRPWEVPILREIHGEENLRQITSGEPIAHARTLGMLGEEEFSFDDIPLEYDRLAQFYGMHSEVKISNCERVYGLFEDGKFEQAVRAACAGKKVADVSSKRDKRRVSLDGLRDQADELGIEWTPSMTPADLKTEIDKLVEAA